MTFALNPQQVGVIDRDWHHPFPNLTVDGE
jgi:hypothetical protein